MPLSSIISNICQKGDKKNVRFDFESLTQIFRKLITNRSPTNDHKLHLIFQQFS